MDSTGSRSPGGGAWQGGVRRRTVRFEVARTGHWGGYGQQTGVGCVRCARVCKPHCLLQDGRDRREYRVRGAMLVGTRGLSTPDTCAACARWRRRSGGGRVYGLRGSRPPGRVPMEEEGCGLEVKGRASRGWSQDAALDAGAGGMQVYTCRWTKGRQK